MKFLPPASSVRTGSNVPAQLLFVSENDSARLEHGGLVSQRPQIDQLILGARGGIYTGRHQSQHPSILFPLFTMFNSPLISTTKAFPREQTTQAYGHHRHTKHPTHTHVTACRRDGSTRSTGDPQRLSSAVIWSCSR